MDFVDSTEQKLENAKQFLVENPTEKMATVARLFKLPYTTLKSSILREKPSESATVKENKWGGSNKILQDHQVKAIHNFIKTLLSHSILPTYALVFSAVKRLKQAENPEFQGPSVRWFRSWWKLNHLHKIKTKPLSTVRFSAAQIPDIERWFDDYVAVLKELNIKKRRNIINFDEAGFRAGCMKGQWILVPEEMKEIYAISPENRRSVTIFENINANGDFPPPPMIVVQGRDIMMNWFHESLPDGTKIMTSENGFTTDEIGVEYLKHYIQNSDAGPDADWKLLLMDNHGSHITTDFVLLANENHIRPFPLIPHLTHCMQPLDVGIFQPYKHWHEVAIQDAIAGFEIEYSVSRLCQDLSKIRNHTFRNSTVRSAFEQSGMWPVNKKKCLNQLKKYNNTQRKNEHRRKRKRELEEPPMQVENPPLPRIRPQTFDEIEQGLKEWLPKIQQHTEWSDPVRPQELDEFVQHTKDLVAESSLNQLELDLYRTRRDDDLAHKASSRKRVKSSQFIGRSGLTKEEALRIIEEKKQKELMSEQKKLHNNFMKMWRIERDEMHAKGVIARKAEKARVRDVKEFMMQNAFIPVEMLVSIEDPEVKWKAENEIWKSEELRKKNAKNHSILNKNDEEDEEDEEEMLFVIDTQGDKQLSQVRKGGSSIENQGDFISFDDYENEEDDEDDEDNDDEIQHVIDDY